MSTISELIDKTPNTPFDEYKISIPTNATGNILREKLLNILGMENEIRTKATKAKLLYRRAVNRQDKVKVLAWQKLEKDFPGMKLTKGRVHVNNIEVEIDGETTTIHQEEERVAMFEYVVERGQDKISEIKDLLDVGRSALSWDKSELGGMNI